MSTETDTMLRMIACSVSVAKKAGAEIKRILKTGKLGIFDKGFQDLQTEADRTAQRMIVASLTRAFPKCTIIGEEKLEDDEEADRRLLSESFDQDILSREIPKKYKNLKEEDITVWVDPLDGTAEFVKGNLDHVTVLIGFSVGGKSVAGVVHQPFFGYTEKNKYVDGRTIWGLVGYGCLGMVPKPITQDDLIFTTTASHINSDVKECIDLFSQKYQVLRVGGAGYKVLMVMEGKAHVYFFPSKGSKRWDTCAPEALLKSFGGALTNIQDQDIVYEQRSDNNYTNYQGVVASRTKALHSSIIESIPDQIKVKLVREELVETGQSHKLPPYSL